jgi:trans-feruloyl-CoA hydratase/vanillin synthase
MSYPKFDKIRLDVDSDGIAVVTLANPEMRNAITRELSAEMNRLLDQVRSDRAIRVVVVTGMGEKSFCAGMSLKDFRELEDRNWELYRPGESMLDWWRKLHELPQPTIAAVNGFCVGGGFCVLNSCDLALASERAIFSLSEINFGSIPGGGAMRAVLETMPPKAAMYLILSGKPIDAEEACRNGLVNRVVAHEQLREEALELARVLAAHPWQTLEWCKRTAYGLKAIPDRELAIQFETAMAHFQDQARPPHGASKAERLEAFARKQYKPGLEAYDAKAGSSQDE